MKKVNLNRRNVIRGLGSIAIALPWLELFHSTKAQAQTGTAARNFLHVYTPGGTVMSDWRCSGSEYNLQLSPILRSLADVKSKLTVLHGIDMKSAVGEQHQAGIVALLTGTPQSAIRNNYANGPSLDQVIAGHIGQDSPKKSLEIAIRWATGKSYGLLHPINSLNFEDNARFSPIPPRLDPVEIWQDMFGTLDPNDPERARELLRKRSILDFVDRRYASLANRLGHEDKQRLEQHLTKLRELENSLNVDIEAGASCYAPALVDTSDYNPKTGLNSSANGSVKDVSTDASIPKIGKLFMDMIVMAMSCEITRVATLQWSDTEAKHTFPWLGLAEHHHFYQHDGGFRPRECTQISTWYAQQHAYLLEQMDAIDMGGHSLLDQSVVLFGSELSDPPTHRKDNMPFLLAGKGGGLVGNKLLNFNGRSHNDMLSAIANLFGMGMNTFGDPRYSGSPITGLTT